MPETARPLGAGALGCGEGYNYMAFYEFESQAKLDEAMRSDALKGLIQEFNAAFGDVERKRITAVEIKSFICG